MSDPINYPGHGTVRLRLALDPEDRPTIQFAGLGDTDDPDVYDVPERVWNQWHGLLIAYDAMVSSIAYDYIFPRRDQTEGS